MRSILLKNLYVEKDQKLVVMIRAHVEAGKNIRNAAGKTVDGYYSLGLVK